MGTVTNLFISDGALNWDQRLRHNWITNLSEKKTDSENVEWENVLSFSVFPVRFEIEINIPDKNRLCSSWIAFEMRRLPISLSPFPVVGTDSYLLINDGPLDWDQPESFSMP